MGSAHVQEDVPLKNVFIRSKRIASVTGVRPTKIQETLQCGRLALLVGPPPLRVRAHAKQVRLSERFD